MKAAVVPAPGARWELGEVPVPRPGPGQVLIRVRACGVCHNDVWLTNGVYDFPPLEPVIVGHEAAGEVVEVGPGVTTREVGDRVGATWVQRGCGRCDYCARGLPPTGQTAMCCAAPVLTGMTAPGGHAEYVAVEAGSTVLLPGGVSYEAAAPVLCAGYTAWSALRAAEPAPGDRVAVLGVGGLGHLALQFARACGFETVAVTRSPDKRELATSLGAGAVVSGGAGLRDAGGADVLLVTNTSYAAATEALQGMRPGGRVALATIDPVGALELGPSSLVWAKRLRVTGVTHDGPDRLAEAFRLVAEGKVTPMVEEFSKEDVADAVEAVDKGAVRFRAVVRY
ncbi:alcohol dehydrogenase catalytic domain-containing protein [Microbispora amethystogenes]|uniref:alcohol dehydrogenase catalytic domain-containing protein n=1 Tax=Microbispora amethystogenes TaxID=1427754 RepID=UPI0033FAF832